MKFQILKLVIWPRSQEFAPREVIFEPGKLNVITGSSRTGKSAIIPIIDYCLGSSDCNIPIDTIRDYASWYGIIIETEFEQVLISRQVPQGTRVSSDFFLSRGKRISVPPAIKEPNEKLESIKHILNTIASVPYISLSENDEDKAFKARLGFRDTMAMIFQTQEIVANQNILFYKTHAHEHRERLRNWLPYIIGAEDMQVLIARQTLQEVDRKLNQLRREFEKAKTISSTWMANMLGQLEIAKEYGLLNEEVITSAKPDDLLIMAKEVLKNIPNNSNTKVQDIVVANTEIEKLENEENQISTEIGLVKKRISDINRLKSGLIDYKNTMVKRVDRLHISKWLKGIAKDSQACPLCGNENHPKSLIEIEKISAAFEKYESESKNVAEIPSSFSREELKLNDQLKQLLDAKKANEKRYSILMSKDKEARNEFYRRKNMFLFLGHLKASTETFESLADGGEFQKEIERLEKERKELLKIIDPSSVAQKKEAAQIKISQGILNHLKNLDVEDIYRKIPPRFDITDLNIKVLSNDNNWHFLAEVGSASNWVSFHISLMCSLQEYFLELKNSCVPSFVIFDQPSQVYFPKLKKMDSAEEYDPGYKDEDVEAVKGIFKTINDSVLGSNGNWQAIILDHADKSIYGEMEQVYEVDNWRNGKKLIPTEWYS